MRRKIKAIFLLMSFISLLAHDTIPHVHIDNANNIATETEHEYSHSHSHNHSHNHNNDLCNSGDKLSASHEHECPHHLHQCSTTYYEYSRSISGAKTSKVKTLLSFRINSLTTDSETFDSDSKEYFEGIYYLYKSPAIGANALRAPPVTG